MSRIQESQNNFNSTENKMLVWDMLVNNRIFDNIENDHFANVKMMFENIISGLNKNISKSEIITNERLLEFADGRLDCLITCHRLSQGIDIKGLKNIFLIASDRSKLETIQRIGRCLRKNPKEPDKKAKIVDFIDSDYDGDVLRSEWLKDLSKIK